jgi:hypothetical protein
VDYGWCFRGASTFSFFSSSLSSLFLVFFALLQSLIILRAQLITPIGVAIGMGVHSAYNPNSGAALLSIGVLDSISAGILIYTGIVEMLYHDVRPFPSLSTSHCLTDPFSSPFSSFPLPVHAWPAGDCKGEQGHRRHLFPPHGVDVHEYPREVGLKGTKKGTESVDREGK